MARDYKHRASGETRKSSKPCGLWFAAGVIVGLFVAGLIWLKTNPALRGTPERPRPVAQRPAPQKKPAPTAPAPRFTFYDVLPEMEVVIPREELKAPPHPGKTVQRKAKEHAKAPPAPTGGGRYILQLGAFTSNAEAERLRARAALLGVQSEIQRISIDGRRTYFRVRSRPYDRDQADRLYARLTQNGVKPLIVKLK